MMQKKATVQSILGTDAIGHLPFSLPVIQGKKLKKKCCKKYRKGKRCKRCPVGVDK
ncbi:MAG: hypothetical protein AAFP19_15845 [Bacteroidota bacterium]